MKSCSVLTILLIVPAILPSASADQAPDVRHPNVLFVAVDDLNDWVSCLGGHRQVRTPHIDRLASRGVLFTNAHCQAPICMPSRTSLLTGTYPWQNGVYAIEQELHNAPLLRDRTTLPRYFRNNGYRTMGAGKIYHRHRDTMDEWNEWGGRYGWKWMGDLVAPDGVSGLPTPSIFDFGPLPVTDAEMNDSKVTRWAGEKLARRHDRPFFLAVGLITPHLPLFTPPRYYDMYPLDEVPHLQKWVGIDVYTGVGFSVVCGNVTDRQNTNAQYSTRRLHSFGGAIAWYYLAA